MANIQITDLNPEMVSDSSHLSTLKDVDTSKIYGGGVTYEEGLVCSSFGFAAGIFGTPISGFAVGTACTAFANYYD
ncbi:hypothetical protein [Okeania sp. SIO1F9]|uniref:hypothetical protein n=1 Tax=Okeania sp. SIO1F9 TaxID=2607813 RepID=UPI00144CE642|nr:hypothetical protein [Okeania sp. SIO1F9]NET76710.1 hypothetical protein [Okeania sp. SIO1F9]